MENFMHILKDIIVPIGVPLTFILGLGNFIFLVSNNRKMNFINIVTRLRSDWFKDLRNNFISYYKSCMDIINGGSKDTIKAIKETTITIQLNFNPYDEEDNKLVTQMQDLNEKLEHSNDVNKINEIKAELQKILSEAQCYVYYEWKGLKKEAEKGILTKCDKNNLVKEFWTKREDKLKKSGNRVFKI